MKTIRILAALAVAVAGLSLSGCEREAEETEEQVTPGVESPEAGSEERTGFGEEADEPAEGGVIEENDSGLENQPNEPLNEDENLD